MRRARAATTSGLSRLTADETTTTAAAPRLALSWPTKTVAPLLAQALDVGVVAQVRALHLMAEVEQHFGDARHADAADADEMDGAELARQFHRSALSSVLGSARDALDEIGEPLGRIGDARALGGSRPLASSPAGREGRAAKRGGEPARA